MTTYAWPTGAAFKPSAMEWGQVHNQRASTSPLSGYTQTSSLPGMRWSIVMRFPAQTPDNRAQLEAMLTKLSGMEHRVSLWDFGHGARTGVPRGTCNTTGVTLNGTHAQFATTLTLNGCGASKTLLAGDKLGLGGQLLTVTDDVTANGSGQITLVARAMLRSSAAGGAAVTLIKPTALFILANGNIAFPRSPGVNDPFECQFVEVFA